MMYVCCMRNIYLIILNGWFGWVHAFVSRHGGSLDAAVPVCVEDPAGGAAGGGVGGTRRGSGGSGCRALRRAFSPGQSRSSSVELCNNTVHPPAHWQGKWGGAAAALI